MSGMNGSKDLEKLVQEIGKLNEAFFPAHIFAVALAVFLVWLCFARPGKRSSNLMKGFQALLHGVIAYGIAVCLFNLGGLYYTFATLLECAVTVLFVVDIFSNRMEFRLPGQKDLKIMPLVLIIYGIFIYPVVELLVGYTWPGIFVFGALCPTTIFSIGVVITALPAASQSGIFKWLLGLMSLGALICGGRAILLGGLFDISYFASGICGFYFLIRYRNSVR